MGFIDRESSDKSSDLNSEVNVTPMVDIMLVLLIIFMVVTPLLQSGVSVSLPKGDNPEEEADINSETAVIISIPFAGSYYVKRDLVAKDDLVSKIEKEMKQRRPSDPQVIYVRAGIGVPYGEVVDVINSIRDANFQHVGLVADRRKPSE
jgi:biopolymer transport protein ExbD/biopolymer transport protein TolR